MVDAKLIVFYLSLAYRPHRYHLWYLSLLDHNHQDPLRCSSACPVGQGYSFASLHMDGNKAGAVKRGSSAQDQVTDALSTGRRSPRARHGRRPETGASDELAPLGM
jgi:hypothetical protein